MDKDQKLTVTLSKRTTSVTLPRDAGKALQYLMAAGGKWISGPELHEVGINDPTNAILELKKLGALIQTIYKDTATPNWELHLDAPNYKYCGWHFNANSPEHTTNPYKELLV